MKKLLLAVLLTAGLGLFGSSLRADDKKSEGEETELTGILIDNNCGADKNEEDAAAHPKACAMKDGCAQSGYQVVVGDKHYKFDDKGNELAKEYLKEEKNTTKVVVKGTVSEDGGIAVTEITMQEEEEEKKA